MQTGDLLEVEAGAAALVPEARDGPKDSSEPRTLPEAQIGTAREALTRDCEAFLDALRPYTGTLPSALFHSVMHSLRVIGPTLSREDIVERSTVSALWGLCHLAKRWALDPDSMLRQNHLLAEVDRKTLEGWIDSMSHAVMMLLDGQNVDVAFAEYEDLRRAAG